MDYDQTLELLFAKLPMFSRIGAAAYKADLDNTNRLCAFLNQPQTKFRTIHIAGTNGKGSVSHMLASILQEAGYKTGLYTSPHLHDFRERIKINGEMISQEFVVSFTEKIQPLIAEIEPSFFEMTVAMAFDYFFQSAVDIAVIETGLGGRLDSTNIILPELSIITNIGYDHMNILGNTLEKIASEKAGIIKEGVNVVIGEALPTTRPVFESNAAEKGSGISFAFEQYQAVDWKWQQHELIVEVAHKNNVDHKVYHLDLTGLYQVKNLLTVLESCRQLSNRGWKIPTHAVDRGLRQTKKLTGLHGRWEIIHHSPIVILDVAHNEDGIRQLLKQIEVTTHRELHLVLGFVKDKEVNAILSMLPSTAHYYFTQASIPRAMGAHELMSMGMSHGLDGRNFANVNTALSNALLEAAKDDLVIVCGSVFLVGEVTLSLN